MATSYHLNQTNKETEDDLKDFLIKSPNGVMLVRFDENQKPIDNKSFYRNENVFAITDQDVMDKLLTL